MPLDYAGSVENGVESTRLNQIDTNRLQFCRLARPEVDLRET